MSARLRQLAAERSKIRLTQHAAWTKPTLEEFDIDAIEQAADEMVREADLMRIQPEAHSVFRGMLCALKQLRRRTTDTA